MVNPSLCKSRFEWKVYWVVACHFLWLRRKKDVHNLEFVRPYKLWLVVHNRVSNYNNVRYQNNRLHEIHKQLIFMTWNAPPIR
jgi:hypothetical protein